MLLLVSSFTSIVTELDVWQQVGKMAESIFVTIARPATFDAVVESNAKVLEDQEYPLRGTFLKIEHEAYRATVCSYTLHTEKYEPSPRQTPSGHADRPRGPPALI